MHKGVISALLRFDYICYPSGAGLQPGEYLAHRWTLNNPKTEK